MQERPPFQLLDLRDPKVRGRAEFILGEHLRELFYPVDGRQDQHFTEFNDLEQLFAEYQRLIVPRRAAGEERRRAVWDPIALKTERLEQARSTLARLLQRPPCDDEAVFEVIREFGLIALRPGWWLYSVGDGSTTFFARGSERKLWRKLREEVWSRIGGWYAAGREAFPEIRQPANAKLKRVGVALAWKEQGRSGTTPIARVVASMYYSCWYRLLRLLVVGLEEASYVALPRLPDTSALLGLSSHLAAAYLARGGRGLLGDPAPYARRWVAALYRLKVRTVTNLLSEDRRSAQPGPSEALLETLKASRFQ